MAIFTTQLRGLRGLHHQPADYYLLGSENFHLHLNPLIDKPITFTNRHEIHCCHCGRKITKTFNNGYCYPCFQKLPQNDLCYVKPNLCHFAAGTCRDASFGETYCNQPHAVYLAYSSNVKVGITPVNNTIQRWMNQGAIQGMVLAVTPTRHIAGQLEAALTAHIADKTNWRKMLADLQPTAELATTWDLMQEKIPPEFTQYIIQRFPAVEITYPVATYPPKIISLDLVKQPVISGILKGMKGQYLILDKGVINVKKYTGHLVEIHIED